MQEISNGALETCCAGDALCMWAAQGLDGRSRAWSSEDRRAVVVAGPALAARDRLAVWGAPDAVVPLACRVLAEVGPAYRPLGDSTLIDVLIQEIAGLEPVGTFGWMDHQGRTGDGPPVRLPADSPVGWVPVSALAEVELLLETSFPDSYAKPGVPGVERWAGVRDHSGRLTAAGSAPTVGFLSGIAVHPQARQNGLGWQVCGFLVAEALRVHGTAALMVNEWNHAAIRLYESLDMRYRSLSAAAVRPRCLAGG